MNKKTYHQRQQNLQQRLKRLEQESTMIIDRSPYMLVQHFNAYVQEIGVKPMLLRSKEDAQQQMLRCAERYMLPASEQERLRGCFGEQLPHEIEQSIYSIHCTPKYWGEKYRIQLIVLSAEVCLQEHKDTLYSMTQALAGYFSHEDSLTMVETEEFLVSILSIMWYYLRHLR